MLKSRFVSRKVYTKNLALLLGILVFIILTISIKTFALQSNTQIRAYLCDDQGPEVYVTSPLSDSVSNDAKVTFEGSTLRTTQIDIFLNNIYSSTLPIEPDAPFSFDVILNKGTNVVTLKAHYSCNSTMQETSVIIDYVPPLKPEPQKIVNGGSGGVVIGPTQSITELPYTSIIDNIINKLTFRKRVNDEENPPNATKIDKIENSFMNSYVTPTINWVIFLGFITTSMFATLPRLFIRRNNVNLYAPRRSRLLALVFSLILAAILII